MTTYSKDEMITATEVVRNFSAVLKSVSQKEKEKVAVVKNNKIEAIFISADQYEKMKDAMDILQKIYAKTKKEA